MNHPYRTAPEARKPRLGRFRRFLCWLGLHRWRLAGGGKQVGFMANTVWYEACVCRHAVRRCLMAPSIEYWEKRVFPWDPDPWTNIEPQFLKDSDDD